MAASPTIWERLRLAEDNIEILQEIVYAQRKLIEELRARRVGDATKRHLEQIHDALMAAERRGQRGLSYPQIAALLGVTPRRARQLRPHLAADGRFLIIRHPRRSNAHVVVLRRG